jgi:hypothetical protein
VDALQAIFKAWNQSTPNIAENLPGWKLTGSIDDNVPCFSQFLHDVPWKGVLCLQYVDSNTTSYISYVVVVVGL